MKFMIKNREEKISSIVKIIQSEISDINVRYRSGPDLYFYKKTNELRNQYDNITSYLNVDYNIEILYATLLAWDMNSRGAKMKYYDYFKSNILDCLDLLIQIEEYENNHPTNSIDIISVLSESYEKLSLMKTKGKLVSNSKLLHFLFPKLCMPMDRVNTLRYFYGNTNESLNKFIEIFKLTQEIEYMPVDWEDYLDDNWNTSVPKLIDNAIILLVGESVK